MNPLGLVPTVSTEDGLVLTENAAVLQWVADRFPEAALAPRDGIQRTRLQERLHFIGSELHKAVYVPLLEKAALDRLEQSAAQASDQVGGRRSIEPAEMLQIVDVSPTFELAQTELVDNDGTTAHVRLLGAQQETYTLTLVQEDGAWHVRIPVP